MNVTALFRLVVTLGSASGTALQAGKKLQCENGQWVSATNASFIVPMPHYSVDCRDVPPAGDLKLFLPSYISHIG